MNTENDKVKNAANSPDSPWRPDDPTWMSERIAEWRKIQKRLAGATQHIPRSYWKHLKAYFFHGVTMPEPSQLHTYRHIEICRWWLHPEEASLTFFEFTTNAHLMRGNFWDFYSDMRSVLEPEGDATYGVMGGREQLLTLALNPCLDSDKEISISGGLTGRCCPAPVRLVPGCIGSTMREIRSYDDEPIGSKAGRDSAYIAHTPKLVLWDHMSAAMDKGEKALYGVESWNDIDEMPENMRIAAGHRKKRIDTSFDRTLMDVLTFFDRDKNNDSRQRPLTVQHVEYLLGRYERKDFSEPLLARWDRAKGLIKPGRAS